MQKKFKGFPCRICRDIPVKFAGILNSQLITCKSYILFNAISTCVPKVRNYGDFRQHVIPTVITCLLRGTPCDTGFSYTFYRGNICSVPANFFCQFDLSYLADVCCIVFETLIHFKSVKQSVESVCGKDSTLKQKTVNPLAPSSKLCKCSHTT